MERIFTPEDFVQVLNVDDAGPNVTVGTRTTYWLVDHLEKVSRAAERRCRPSARQAGDGSAASLRDASVHLDVAAAIYRLLLERSGDDALSLSDCLACVCAAMLEPLGIRNRCNFEFYCEPGCSIPASRAFAVGAIAVEAVINALHHAHPAGVRGRLSIACRRKGDAVIMEIGDDGVGLPEGFALGRDAGIGLGNAIDMADAADARLSLESRPLGLTLRLVMDAAAAVDGAASP